MRTRIYRSDGGWRYLVRYRGVEVSHPTPTRAAAVFMRSLAVAEVYARVCQGSGVKSLEGYAGEPAFAVPGTPDSYQQVGLTKREYFAVMALQGLLANDGGSNYEADAEMAVKQADALLKTLLSTDPPKSPGDVTEDKA